jgi:hypothetical protein
MKRKIKVPLRVHVKHRRVDSPRNSRSGSAKLSDLDFSQWWTDVSFGQHYLHVPHKGHGGMAGTVHRVKCRLAECPRLLLKNGKLYWIIDEKGEN